MTAKEWLSKLDLLIDNYKSDEPDDVIIDDPRWHEIVRAAADCTSEWKV